MDNQAAVVLGAEKSVISESGNVEMAAEVNYNKTWSDIVTELEEAAKKDGQEDLKKIAEQVKKDKKLTTKAIKDNLKIDKIKEALDNHTMNTSSTASSDGDDVELPVVATGTVGIENVTNNANVYVGKNATIDAAKEANLTASVQGLDTNKAGKFVKSDESTSEGASVGIGGTVAVQNTYDNSKVEVASGATIKGATGVNLNASNDVLNIVTAVGGSKSSTVGLTGMVSYMGGESNSRVLVDSGANLISTAEGKESTGEGGGSISLKAENSTILGNFAGQLSESEQAAIGASVGVTSYDVYSEAKVKKLTDGDTTRGQISGDSLSIAAENTSFVGTLSAAGVSSQSKSSESSEKKDESKDDAAGTSVKVRDKKSSSSESSEKKEEVMIELQDLSVSSEGKEKAEETSTQADDEDKKENISVSKDEKDNATEQSKDKTEEQKKENSKVNIAAAGSISWNDVNTSAEAELSDIDVHIGTTGVTRKDDNDKPIAHDYNVDVTAEDSTYIASLAGAMARTKLNASTKKEEKKDDTKTDTTKAANAVANDAGGSDEGASVTLAGAVAGNDLVKSTKATMSNITIDNTTGDNELTITNSATNKGVQVAAGVAYGETAKSNAGVTGSTGASANYVDSTVNATMDQVSLTKTKNTAVNNLAKDSDIQIAGGISVDYAKNSAGLGASVSINKVKNDIEAVVRNSTLGDANNKIGSLNNEAVSSLVQVGTAVSVGIASGDKNYALINGAVAANTVSNTIKSNVDKTSISSNGDVYVTAHDGDLNEVKGATQASALTNDYASQLAEDGFDVDGSSMKDYTGKDTDVDHDKATVETTTTVDGETQKTTEVQYTNSEYQYNGNGNTVVSGAVGVATGKTNASVAAGVNYNKISNDYSASITGDSDDIKTIQAKDVDVVAASKTNMIGVAGGAAVSTKDNSGSVAGSVAINNLSNKISADVENAAITFTTVSGETNNLNVLAQDNAVLVTVAGQASVSKGNVAAGMSWAQNDIDNKTTATVKNTTVGDSTKQADNTNVKATDKSTLVATSIAGGVTAGGSSSVGVTLEGAFAGNVGSHSSEAIVEGSELNSTNVAVNSEQSGKTTAVAGEAAVSTKTVAVGGAVALNKMGTSDAHQSNIAKISDTKLNATDVEVLATDKDTLTTIAVGGAVVAGAESAGVSVQGSVTSSTHYKDTKAEVSGIETAEGSDDMSLDVEATRSNKITSSADAVSVSAGGGSANISVAAGVSNVHMAGDVAATLKDSANAVKASDVKVIADTANKIMNVGIGASVAAGGSMNVAANANVAVNKIDTNTNATISGMSSLEADGVRVKANSEDVLKNYAGALSVAAGSQGAAAVGATTVVNTIIGDTAALVENSNITFGNEELEDQVTEYTANSDDQGTMTSSAKKAKGLAVTADSTHTLDNVAVTAGVAAAGVGSGALDATVAVNKIAGSTKAEINGSQLTGTAATDSDITVLANDTSTMTSKVVSLSIAGSGTGAGVVGAAVENSKLNRDVLASINGGNTSLNKEAADINTRGDVAVKATNTQKVKLDTYGSAAAGSGVGSGSVAGSVSVDTFGSTSKAQIKNVQMKALDVDVTADTAKQLTSNNGSHAGSGAIGSGTVSVGVINATDSSSTEAILQNAKLDNIDATGTAQHINVLATNNSFMDNQGTNGSLNVSLGGSVGTNVNVNTIKNTVRTLVDNVTVDNQDDTYDTFKADAENNVKLKSTNVVSAEGLATVGVGVSVNTINSSTNTVVKNSTIKAKEVTADSNETRTLDTDLVGANVTLAGTVSVNASVNTIGTAMQDNYDYEEADTTKKDSYVTKNYSTSDIKSTNQKGVDKSNAVLNSLASDAYTKDAVDKGTEKADYGSNSTNAGVGTSISGSTLGLENGDSVKVSSNAVTNGDVYVGQGSVGLIGVNVSVGVTDVKSNNKVSITDSTLNANAIDVAANNGGKVEQEVLQSGVAGLGINVAVSKLNRTGSNAVDIDGSTLLASTIQNKDVTDRTASSLNISALDNMTLNNTVKGWTSGAVNTGAMVSKVTDKTNNTVNIKNGSQLTAVDYTTDTDTIVAYDENGKRKEDSTESYEKPEYRDVNISATSSNTITTSTGTGKGGMTTEAVKAGLVVANATIAEVELGSAKDATVGMTSVNLSGTNTLAGKNINLISKNATEANANSGNVNAGAITGGGVRATINAYGGSKVALGDANLVADAVAANALTAQKIVADAKGVAGSIVNININLADASLSGTTSVEGGNVTIKKSEWKDTEKQSDYSAENNKDILAHEEQVAGGTLKLQAEDTSAVTATSVGSAGSVVASGTNKATTANTGNTSVSLASQNLQADSLSIQANSNGSTTAKAKGTGGGIVNVSPEAAYVNNTNTATSNVNLSGNYDVTGNVDITAANTNSTALWADAMSVELLGGSGVKAINTSTQTSKVALGSGTTINAGGSVDVAARNEYTLGAADNADYMVRSNGYGGEGTQVGGIENTINDTANVDLGRNSSIESTGNQKISATSKNDLTAKAYAFSLGLLEGTFVDNTLNATVNDTVTQQSGSSLKTTDEDSTITVAAADTQKATLQSIAETSVGVAGATSSRVTDNITRNNQVNINGDVYSRNNVNLYAGKYADDEYGALNMDLTSKAYNLALLPLGFTPTIDSEFIQNNSVNINSSGNVRAIQDINLYASAGRETLSQSAGAFAAYGGKNDIKYVGMTNGEVNVKDGKKLSDLATNIKDNHVTVNGKATAGTANVQKVTIGDVDKTMVVLTKDEYSAVEAYYKNRGESVPSTYVVAISDKDYNALSSADRKSYYRKLSDLVKITDSDGKVNTDADVTAADFSVGYYEYAHSLKERMDELINLMAEYPTGAAHAGYSAEYERLADELVSSGMGSYDDKTGNYTLNNDDIGIAYIEIPELVASGGNINITTDNLSGSGTLTAKGSPNIEIQNYTSMALNVNNLTVVKPGGNIYYNNNNVQSSDEIKKYNKDQTKTVSNVKATGGAAGAITVSGNYQGDKSYDYRVNDTNKTAPVMANVNIQGTIRNDSGIIDIESRKDDINISGKNAAVVGKEIHLTAGGSISQTYTKDIVNIGGDVQSQYGTSGYKNQNATVKQADKTVKAENGSYVAGDSVFINAEDININGLIQSGFDNYHVEIAADTKLNTNYQISDSGSMTVKDRMAKIEALNGGSPISDKAVKGNAQYCLISGGKTYNSTKGYYESVVSVYYNPSNGHILTEDVESKGGKIFITGRIASTGNGQILCLDGASDINVKNDLSNDLVTGQLITNDVTGTIRIGDSNSNLINEITRNDDGTMNVKVYDMDTGVVSVNGNVTDIGSALTGNNGNGGLKYDEATGKLYYAPEQDLRYNWTTGQSYGISKKYEKTWQNHWWGLDKKERNVEQGLIDETKTTPVISETKGETTAKRNGAYIGTNTDVIDANLNDENFVISYGYSTGNKSVKIDKTDTWRSGFLWCHKNYYKQWTVTEGTTNTMVYSVNAHQNVPISFIGKADGNSTVNVTSQGNINLTNTVGNRTSYSDLENRGTVNIISNGGSITQSGGTIYGADVALKAAGNITNVDITAGNNLNLTVGSLFDTTNALTKNVSINVEGRQDAAGNVVLATEYQKQGNNEQEQSKFELTTSGSEGNITTKEDNTIKSKRIDLTSENGAITASVKAGQEALNTDTLSASVNAQAKGDITLTQTEGDMRVGRIYSDNGDVTVNVPKGSVVDALPYGSFTTEDENYLIKQWTEMGILSGQDDETFQTKKALVASGIAKYGQEEEYKDLNDFDEYKGWSKEALLYTVSNGVLNPTSESIKTESTKDPNIKANNININVSENAGITSGKVTTINADDIGTTGTGLDNLKTLAQADASTVKWNADSNSFVITETLPIGVQTNTAEGKLNVSAMAADANKNGNVYVEGRTQIDESIIDKGNTDLSISSIMANGNVSITSLGNILNGAGDGNVAITGGSNKDVFISANGTIGTAENALTTSVDILQTISKDNTYISQLANEDGTTKTLAIRSMSSAGDIELSNVGDIVMKDATGTTGAADTYIQTEKGGNITLTSTEGSIGSVETEDDGDVKTDEDGKPIVNGVRVLNQANGKTGKVIVNNNENNKNTVAIEGMSTDVTGATDAGTLNVEFANPDVVMDNVALISHGALNVNSDITADKNIVLESGNGFDLNINKNLTAGKTLYASSQGALNVSDAALKGETTKLLAADNISAVNASLEATGTLTAEAGKAISLEKGTVTAVDANLIAKDGLTAEGETLEITGTLTADAGDGSITLTDSSATTNAATLTAGKDVSTINTSISATEGLNVTATNGAITANGGTLNGGTTELTAGKDVGTTNTSISASEALTVNAGKDITVTGGSLDAKTAALSAANAVKATDAAIDAKDTLTINAENGAITLKNDTVTAANSAELTAGGDLTLDGGTAQAAALNLKGVNVLQNATNAITASTLNVVSAGHTKLIGAANDLATVEIDDNGTNVGTVEVINSGDKDVKLNVINSLSGAENLLAGSLEVTNNGSGSLTLAADKALNASGTVKVNAVKGDLNTTENVAAAQGITLTSAGDTKASGNLSAAAGTVTVTSGKDLQLANVLTDQGITLTSEGNTTVNGVMKAETGDINATSKGAMTLNGGEVISKEDSNTYVVTALANEGNISLKAVNDVINNNLIVANAGNVDITSDNGKITTNMVYGTGTTTMTAQDTITTTSVIWGDDGLNLTSKAGDVVIGEDLFAVDGDINIDAANDVTFDTSSVAGKIYAYSTNGALNITAGNNITTDTNDILGGDNVTLVADKGNVTNNAVLAADYDILVQSNQGNIINNASLIEFTGVDDKDNNVSISPTVADNITLRAENGSIQSGQEIMAMQDVTIQAKTGLDNFGTNIYAGRDILLEVEEGNLLNESRLEAYAGDVTLHAKNGTVANTLSGNIYAFGGDVTLLAGGTGDGKVEVDGTYFNEGSVINRGNILAKDDNAADADLAGNINLKSEHADVYNYDSFIGKNTTSVKSDYAARAARIDKSFDEEDVNYSYIVAAKNLDMSAAEGELYNAKDVLGAEGNVTLTAKTGLNSLGMKIYAGGDIKLTATEGSMVNKSELISTNGDIELVAEKGSVINMLDGDILALGGNVKFQAGGEKEAAHTLYQVDSNGNITAVTNFTQPEDMADDAIVITKKFYYVNGEKHYVDANDKVSQIKDTIYSEVYYINTAGDQTELNIASDGTNVLKDADVEFFRQGDVINRGDAIAKGTTAKTFDESGEAVYTVEKAGTITLESLHGNSSNYDNFETVDGEGEYEFDGANLFLAGTKDTKGDNLYEKKKYMQADSNISLRAAEGRFYNDFAIKTEGDLELVAKDDIVIGKNFAIADVAGKLVINSSEGMVKNDENSVMNITGDIDVSGAAGVINKGSLISKGGGNVTVTSSGGDIVVGTLSGGQVVVITEGEGKTIDVNDGSITTDKHLTMKGDYVDGTVKVGHGDNYAGTIGLTIGGRDDNAMKGEFKLENDGDTTTDLFHVTDAHLNIGADGSLKADNVKTEGDANFDVKGARTTILGRSGGEDNGQFIYSNTGDWMNFFIDNRTRQTSSANLIHVEDGYFVTNQRYAMDDEAGNHTDFRASDLKKLLLNENFGLYDRYNVYNTSFVRNDMDAKLGGNGLLSADASAITIEPIADFGTAAGSELTVDNAVAANTADGSAASSDKSDADSQAEQA